MATPTQRSSSMKADLYNEWVERTSERGPDACIHAVGLESDSFLTRASRLSVSMRCKK